MSNPKIDQLALATGETSDTIYAMLGAWHGQKIKKIIKSNINLAIEERRTKLESCKPEELTDLQGNIKGLRIAIGALDIGQNKDFK